MIFRNSIFSVLGAALKTLLFVFLITVLTLALYLGVNMWEQSNNLISECDKDFTTVAVLEYLGADYPDESIYDSRMQDAINSFDMSQLSENESVLSWLPGNRAYGRVEGFKDMTKNAAHWYDGIVVVKIGSYNSGNNSYLGSIVDILYGADVELTDALYVDFSAYDEEFTPEKGSYYVVSGRFRGYALYNATIPDSNILSAAGIDAESFVPYMDISGTLDEFLAEGTSDYHRIAEYFDLAANCAEVYVTDNLEAELPFNQEQVSIISGRKFSAEEYSMSAKVCILSERIANAINKKVGDKINLSLYPDIRVINENISVETAEYTIVGLTNAATGSHKTMYIPGDANSYENTSALGYTVARAVLKNGSADSFLNTMSPLLPDRMELTAYDQGYAAITASLMSVRQNAALITVISAIVTLAVLILFATLYVYRQRETVATMSILGTQKYKTRMYLVWGSSLIIAFSVFIGTTYGMKMASVIKEISYEAATESTYIDTRYSNASLGIVRELDKGMDDSSYLPIISAVAILLIGVSLCLIFAQRSMKTKKSDSAKRREKKQKSVKYKKLRCSSYMRGGPLKFSLLSIRRGGLRTFIVPVVSIVIVVFVCSLASTRNDYQNQLRDINDKTTIDISFTDSAGKPASNLAVSAYSIGNVLRSGLLEDPGLSRGFNYIYTGTIEKSDGSEAKTTPLSIPYGNQYAYEEFLYRLTLQPMLIFTNNLGVVPEFINSSSITTEFLEGYDLSVFTKVSQPIENTENAEEPEEPGEDTENTETPEESEESSGRVLSDYKEAYDTSAQICMVPQGFLEKNGLRLGDVIQIRYGEYFNYIQLMIVGTFAEQGSKYNIYCPLSLDFDLSVFEKNDRALKNQSSFSTVSIKLKNTADLEDFKDYLEQLGFSYAGHISSKPLNPSTNRTFILIKDKMYMQSVANLTSNLNYLDMIYPIMFILIGALSLVISYLLMVGRKSELALMRGFGAGKLRTYLSFFLEQFLLCIAGSGAGMAVAAVMGGGLILGQLVSSLLFVGCYFVGCTISIMIMNGSKILKILSERE